MAGVDGEQRKLIEQGRRADEEIAERNHYSAAMTTLESRINPMRVGSTARDGF
jgi:hypothetical protein